MNNPSSKACHECRPLARCPDCKKKILKDYREARKHKPQLPTLEDIIADQADPTGTPAV
jgi:hypothetical protein